MKAVETGTLLTGAERVSNDNALPVWRAIVAMRSKRQVHAFIKHVPMRTLVVEIVASMLGRHLGLPIPRPLLVQVLPARLPHAGLKETTIFFGSERVGQPDFAQWLNDQAGAYAAISSLRRWPKAIDTGCFDEWLANHDRHPRNILFDGRAGFVLIDHSHAIPEGLASNAPATENQVLQTLLENKSRREVQAISAKAKKSIESYSAIPLDSFLNMLLQQSSQFADSGNEAIEFLKQRLPFLNALIEQRLGSTQRDLINDPSNGSPYSG